MAKQLVKMTLFVSAFIGLLGGMALAETTLTPSSCVSNNHVPESYSSWHDDSQWMGVAVRPNLDTSNLSLVLEMYELISTTQVLMNSTSASASTNLLIKDFSTLTDQYIFPRVTNSSNTDDWGDYVIVYDQGQGALPFNIEVEGNFGGIGWDCGLFRVWDLSLEDGKSYEFLFNKEMLDLMGRDADIRMMLFHTGGQNGWLTRGDALFDEGAADEGVIDPFSYTAQTTGKHALVIITDSEPGISGRYTLTVQPQATNPEANLVIDSILPDTATENAPISVTVTIRNEGGVSAGTDFLTRVSVDGSTKCSHISTPDIPAGQIGQVTCDIGSYPAGTYSVETCADVPPPGQSTGQVTESDENDNCWSEDIEVLPQGTQSPNLIVSYVHSAPIPAYQGCALWAKIRNIGGEAPATYTQMKLGDSIVCAQIYTRPLSNSEEDVVECNIGPQPPGQYEVEFCTDITNLAQSQPHCLSATITSVSNERSDLIIDHIDPDAANDVQNVWVTVSVRNQGSADAAASNAWIRVDGPPTYTELPTPAIPAGEVRTFSYNMGRLSAGTHTVTAYTDHQGAVSESNESNNEKSETIMVRPMNVFLSPNDGSVEENTIQYAIDHVAPGGYVFLESGTYTGNGNRNLDFRGKALTITRYGSDIPVIDCEGNGRAFCFHSGEGPTSMVMNLQIINGATSMFYPGGAVRCVGPTSPEFRNCFFVNNSSSFGGAVSAEQGASPRLIECEFEDNHATFGGGLFSSEAGPILSGCIFYMNSGGGIVSAASSALTIDHCTLVKNTVGIATDDTSTADVKNTIVLFSTEAEAIYQLADNVTLSCSNLYGNTGGDWVGYLEDQFKTNGNISDDPLFCEGDDFYLQADSPCTAANTETCGYIGARQEGCPPSVPSTFVIRPDGSGDFSTIQEAVGAAWAGDTIELIDGIYTGPGNTSVVLYGTESKAITIRSQSGNPGNCIIDCEGSSSNWRNGFNFSGFSQEAQATLESITIRNGYYPWGGGIFCRASSPTIRNIIFENCRADGYSSYTCSGGAIYCQDYSSPMISRCNFVGNSAQGSGGAICSKYDCNLIVINCAFTGNTAQDSGGGIFVDFYSDIDLINNSFSHNSAENYGGGFYLSSGGSGSAAANCIWWGNSADMGPQIALTNGGELSLTHSSLQGGQVGAYVEQETTLSWDGTNISEDPLFTNALGLDGTSGTMDDNLRLSSGSPCIDAGDNSAVLKWHDIDLDGRFRFIDDPDAPPDDAVVDMGAYERGPLKYYIWNGNTTGVKDGSSSHPFPTIQEGLDLVMDGDTVIVADGTYQGAGNKDLDFHGKAILLRSMHGPESCIIDCEGDGRGVYFNSGEGPETVFEGFTIVNGYAFSGGGINIDASSPTIKNCILDGNEAYGSSGGGGGINILNGNPTITACTLTGNTSVNAGGGMCNSSSAPAVIDCTFETNHAHWGGGGMRNYSSSPEVTDCRFIENTTDAWGGGMHNNQAGSIPNINSCLFKGNHAGQFGGGMYNRNAAAPLIRNSIFEENTSSQGGGGIYSRDDTSPTVESCLLMGNSAVNSGGGMYNRDTATPTVVNSIFSGNSVGNYGAGMHNYLSVTAEIINCTFTNNIAGAGYQGGAVYNSSATAIIASSILWGNAPDELAGGNMNVSYSNVDQTGYGVGDGTADGNGNIRLYPLLANPYGPDDNYGTADDNLKLLPGSPCIDAGNSLAVPEGITTDIGGGQRFYNHPDVVDTGVANAQGAVVDMGAYEIDEDDVDTDNDGMDDLWEISHFGNLSRNGFLDYDEDGLNDREEFEHDTDPKAKDSDGDRMEDGWEVANNLQPLVDDAHSDSDWDGFTNWREFMEGTDPRNMADAPVSRAIYVDRENNSGLEDGTSAYPFNTIQEGIDFAGYWEQVWVSDGTYTGEGNKNLDFRGKSITLQSQNGPLQCTIDCEGSGRGFYFHNYERENSVVSGFTIQNGYAYQGGGLLITDNSSPSISNCIVTANEALDDGGGLYCYNGASPEISQVVFSYNQSGDNGGGAYFIEGCVPTVTQCMFFGNYATDAGGGIGFAGAHGHILQCTFHDNSTGNAGGGGMFCHGYCEPVFENCTFYNNTGPSGGTALIRHYSTPVIENSIIAFSSMGNAVYCVSESSVILRCTNIYGNAAGDWDSCIQSQFGVNGNISEDPLFCDTANNDFTLYENSPCATASCGLLGAWPVGCVADCTDNDHDGYAIEGGPCGEIDCDDGNPNRFPGNPENCDGLDNDCDGDIDEGFAMVTVCYDNDGDGFGNRNISAQQCGAYGDYVADCTDCDDTDNAITGCNTPPGDDPFTVFDPATGMEITYPRISSGGETTIQASAVGNAPPPNFQVRDVFPQSYFEINCTTADGAACEWEPPLMICFTWDEGDMFWEEGLRIFQENEIGNWVDVTCTPGLLDCPENNPDVENNRICAYVDCFSGIALFENIGLTLNLNKGINFVAYAGNVPSGLSAYELLKKIGPPEAIDKLMIYSPIDGNYSTCYYDSSGNPSGENYPITNYSGMQAFAKQPHETKLYYESACGQGTPLFSGRNEVGFNCVTSPYTSFQFLSGLGFDRVISIQRFNPRNGMIETASISNGLPSGIDFEIKEGEGYMVFMKTNYVWP